MAFSNKEKMDIYEAAERYNPGYGAASAVFKVGLGLLEVTMVPHKGNGPDLRVMFTRDGIPAGFPGKAQSSRDMPGARNPARRGRKPTIGRRKTVKTSAKGLISRRNRRKVKSSMFRMNQKAKLLGCHACSRNDFATEKSLKAHTSKFHTPGQKSPRGFRTARDASTKSFIVIYCHTFRETDGDHSDFKRFRDKGQALKFMRKIRENGGEASMMTRDVSGTDLRARRKWVSDDRAKKRKPSPYFDSKDIVHVNSAERRRGRRWLKRLEHPRRDA